MTMFELQQMMLNGMDPKVALNRRDAGEPLTLANKLVLGLPILPVQQRMADQLVALSRLSNDHKLSWRQRQLLGVAPTAKDRVQLGQAPTLADKIAAGEKLNSWQQRIADLAKECYISLRQARRILYSELREAKKGREAQARQAMTW